MHDTKRKDEDLDQNTYLYACDIRLDTSYLGRRSGGDMKTGTRFEKVLLEVVVAVVMGTDCGDKKAVS